MQISQDEMQVLRARFESYGRAAVERDLAQPERKILLSPEMTDFARNWLEETAWQHQRNRMTKFMMTAAGIEFGVSVSINVLHLV